MMRLIPAALVLLVATAATIPAQDSLPEIRQRFKERYRDLFMLKVEGKIGEAFDGYVELVAAAYGDGRIRSLLEAENRDRKKSYELLAEELRARAGDEREQARITPELVARRNAARNFEDARSFEHLRMADGVWIQKKEEASYRRILQLKSDGVVGESAEGYLAVRKDDGVELRLVEQENERRRLFYGKIAELRDAAADKVAGEYGRAHLKSARPGDWLLSGGVWSQRERKG